MKANTHPTYFEEAQVICVCGNRFKTGSTQEIIHVELCNKCHPFYTGEHRFLDRGSKIQRFQEKQKIAQQYHATKKQKAADLKKKDEAPKSLREMLMSLK
jgi:large subunit ribosomal protein L31